MREFPNVALEDVWRYDDLIQRGWLDMGTDIETPAMLAKHDIVNRMTI